MGEAVTKKEALAVLEQSACAIRQLISNQRSTLCLTGCPAFEEVADTRLFGFACEVKFAVACDLISYQEGQQLIRKLEDELEEIKKQAFKDSENIE
ncbi:DUF1507 family protein [Ligilactobacillus sp. Marseille-Q7487]|jgi:uncharacterized protein YlaN (UPF0358 family)|uniref:DUF1507 family protein n=1 Tax=Ligilactobacillus sp. Marseille-Q7487 TaxID=3022128 RepID=UPI0015B4E872|nr:DUF1507 family protein [Ligilactobacillus sp. Marseille-Q7487]